MSRIEGPPFNQRVSKNVRERQDRAFGDDRKAKRAYERRMRLEEDEKQLLQDRQAVQFERVLGKVMDEEATPKDVDYFLKNIERYERPLETFNIERIGGNGETRTTKVTIAEIVVFDRNDKAISPEGNELEANIA